MQKKPTQNETKVDWFKIDYNKFMKGKESTGKYSIQCSSVQNALNTDCQKLEGCTSKRRYSPSFLHSYLNHLDCLLLETKY